MNQAFEYSGAVLGFTEMISARHGAVSPAADKRPVFLPFPAVLLGSVPTVWRGAARPATFWRLIKIERDYFVWDFTFFKLTHFFFLLELLQNNKMEWICEAIYVMRPVWHQVPENISQISSITLTLAFMEFKGPQRGKPLYLPAVLPPQSDAGLLVLMDCVFVTVGLLRFGRLLDTREHQ